MHTYVSPAETWLLGNYRETTLSLSKGEHPSTEMNCFVQMFRIRYFRLSARPENSPTTFPRFQDYEDEDENFLAIPFRRGRKKKKKIFFEEKIKFESKSRIWIWKMINY